MGNCRLCTKVRQTRYRTVRNIAYQKKITRIDTAVPESMAADKTSRMKDTQALVPM